MSDKEKPKTGRDRPNDPPCRTVGCGFTTDPTDDSLIGGYCPFCSQSRTKDLADQELGKAFRLVAKGLSGRV